VHEVVSLKRVTGLGGIFFKANDPKKLKAWYQTCLGLASTDAHGSNDEGEQAVVFRWRDNDNPNNEAYTVWAPFPHDTQYFEPSKVPFMINYRVENLEKLLEELRKEGVHVEDRIEEYPYGKFGWIMDPEGNRIELWEPK
jgi:predicted enzyme related to lactoylglutathione lyase